MMQRASRRNQPLRSILTIVRLTSCAMFLLVLTLTACGTTPTPTPPAKTISFPEDVFGRGFLPGKTYLDIKREDTDSDGQLEWVVFYRFDQVGGGGPVAALIYDIVVDPEVQLPIAYPYKLRTPDQNYLSQDIPNLSLAEIVREDGNVRKELVFSTETELVFFRVTRDPKGPPVDNPPLYRCIGFFRSDGGVSFNPGNLQVTVTSRAGYERSQLVTRREYKPGTLPEADGYFLANTTTLVAPFESRVDFPEGIPATILDTPYPEKIVLAFYQTLGKSDAQPALADYLSPQAATELTQLKLRYGSPLPPDQIQRAIVQELSYYPTQEDSTTALVTAKVIFQPKTGQPSPLIEVRWRLVRIGNRWKMDYAEPS
nr:hypothetical protein [Chloroflexota bacterium]